MRTDTARWNRFGAPARALLLVMVPLVAGVLPALAAPTDPIVVVPTSDEDGEIFDPTIRVTPVLESEYGYVIEEFLVSGTSSVYTYEDPPVREVVIPLETDVPYTTRIIVMRPADAIEFNGTVVVEWWNSSAMFDTAPVWDPSGQYFARKGIAYVGVTNASVAAEFLADGCKLLGAIELAACGERYADVELQQDGQAFEMVSQIANALKGGAKAGSPLPPDFAVERVFHAGQSQQGGSMVTYASAFHFPANDGYFIQAASSARPINFRTACGSKDALPYPDCTPRLEGDARRVRTDLPVPVLRAMTGSDVPGVLDSDARQQDSESFRYYELPGTAHVTVHRDIEPVPGIRIEEWCRNPLNTIADGPVIGGYIYNALWEAMEQRVTTGTPLPSGDLIDTTKTNEVALDPHGNAAGGIRHPALEVPVATYTPNNTFSDAVPPAFRDIALLFCRLAGSVARFEDETIESLYPNQQDYEARLDAAIEALLEDRLLLDDDAGPLREQLIAEYIPEPSGALLQAGALLAVATRARARRAAARGRARGRRWAV